MRIGEG